jgi:hypothetical protein
VARPRTRRVKRPDPVSDLVLLAEADIKAFEARMREVVPAYQPGDRVVLLGEVFEVAQFQREGMPGYWLGRSAREEVFLPLDLEGRLQLLVH